MIWLLLAIAAVTVLAVLIVLGRRYGGETGVGQFRARGSVLDGDERRWLAVLEEAAGPERRVLPLVPAARLASPAAAAPAAGRRLARHRLARTRFSFVICERESLAVHCVAEPHRPRWSRRRHAIATICSAAGIALVDLPQAPDSPGLIRKRLDAVSAPMPVPACPQCGLPMRLHHGRRGALAGHAYWRCSDFPSCRAVAPAEAGETLHLSAE